MPAESVPVPPPQITPDESAKVQLDRWNEQVQETIFYARVAARSKGYALAVHGTLRRDIDLVAVPWTDAACGPDELAQHITESLIKSDASYEQSWEIAAKSREEKPHGRVAWSIPLKWKHQTGAGMYVDLSVSPPAAAFSAPQITPTHPHVVCPECGENLDGVHHVDECASMIDVSREVLCRVFDDGADAGWDEWLTFDKSGWFWWGRALGAFIRIRADRLAKAAAFSAVPQEPSDV